jgi:FAD/FMN-containing dehydrogenase
MTTRHGTSGVVDDAGMVQALRSSLRGEVIDRDHPDYDQARRVWNGLIDRRPASSRAAPTPPTSSRPCGSPRAVPPAGERRGGGHQIAGSGVCDDGLVIDLSAMRESRRCRINRRARAQGGATWGDVDRETQRFGLATPGGEVSTTGIGGFTLGGGMGLLMRRHGMACDNVRALEIVTADGERAPGQPRTSTRTCSGRRAAAGAASGVVTEFEYALHPLGPDVAVAQVFYPYEDAARLLKAWPEVALGAPDTVTPQIILWSIPPDPTIPTDLHGRKTVIVLGVYAGPAADGDAALAPLRAMAEPLLDVSGTMKYLEVQSSVDAVFPAGGRYYMKSHFMDALPDAAVQTAIEWYDRRPTPDTLLVIRTLGGAVSRVKTDETAYPHRSAAFNVSLDSGWTDPALDAEGIGWARGTWDALAPYAAGGVYINFSGLDEEADALRGAVFGGSRDRLAEIRATYDPTGLFEGASRRP